MEENVEQRGETEMAASLQRKLVLNAGVKLRQQPFTPTLSNGDAFTCQSHRS